MSPWQKVYDREPLPGAPLSRGGLWWLVYLVVGGGIGASGAVVRGQLALGRHPARTWATNTPGTRTRR